MRLSFLPESLSLRAVRRRVSLSPVASIQQHQPALHSHIQTLLLHVCCSMHTRCTLLALTRPPAVALNDCIVDALVVPVHLAPTSIRAVKDARPAWRIDHSAGRMPREVAKIVYQHCMQNGL
jgi:hypothetical protein